MGITVGTGPEQALVVGSLVLQPPLHPSDTARTAQTALGQGAKRLPDPNPSPYPGATTQFFSSSSSRPALPCPVAGQGATGQLQPPPARENSERLLLSAGTVRHGGVRGVWVGAACLWGGVPDVGRGPGCAPLRCGHTQRALTSTGRVPEGGGGFGEPLVDYRVDVFGEVYGGHRAPARTWRREKTQGH